MKKGKVETEKLKLKSEQLGGSVFKRVQPCQSWQIDKWKWKVKTEKWKVKS